MKITVHFKTPDALFYALRDLNEDEKKEAENKLEKWVEFGETVSITFDLDNMTAKVNES